MTQTQWQAKVTELVEAVTGPNFGWDDVSEGEWNALWLKRLTAQEAAHELLNAVPPDAE